MAGVYNEPAHGLINIAILGGRTPVTTQDHSVKQVGACSESRCNLHLIQHLWQNSTKTVNILAPHHWKIGMYAEIPPGNLHGFMLPSSTLDRQPGVFRFFLAPKSQGLPRRPRWNVCVLRVFSPDMCSQH